MIPSQASANHRPERDLKPTDTARVPVTSGGWGGAESLAARLQKHVTLLVEEQGGNEGKELETVRQTAESGSQGSKSRPSTPTIDFLGRRWHLTPGGSQGGVSRQPFHSLCTHKIYVCVSPCKRQKHSET